MVGSSRLAEELYEAYRREVAAAPKLPDYREHWAELSVADKHLWKGVAERIGPLLAEAMGAR